MNLIEEEILKAERLIQGLEFDTGKESSPLCKEFKNLCRKCPVYQKTGWRNCAETPLGKLTSHLIFSSRIDHIISECPECEKHLRDWIEFLKSLSRETLERPSKTLRERIMMGPFV